MVLPLQETTRCCVGIFVSKYSCTFIIGGNNGTKLDYRGLSPSWWTVRDTLANRLNVPILFYNAAWEGTASKIE